MEAKGLTNLILVLVLSGLLLGIGILTLGKFSTIARESVTVIDEQVTLTSGAGTTAHGNITTWSEFYNATDATDTYALVLGENVTASSGAIALVDTDKAGVWNVSYIYDEEKDASTSVNSVVEAVSPIASDWMPLIVTISILSIVLFLVMKSFAVRTR